MTKKMFVAAFTIDSEIYGSTPDTTDIAHFLPAVAGEEGLGDLIVWGSADDMIADHVNSGPVNLGYLTEGQETEGAADAGLAARSKLALSHLVAARDLFKSAGASSRLLDKINLAISSGRGAVRNATNKDSRPRG